MFKRLLSGAILTPLTVVALVVSSSACGTIMNFSGGGPHTFSGDHPDRTGVPIPYGGVRADLLTPNWEHADHWKLDDIALVGPILALDISLSFVLDTITLPLVVWINIDRAINQETLKRERQNAVPTFPEEMPLPPMGEPRKAQSK